MPQPGSCQSTSSMPLQPYLSLDPNALTAPADSQGPKTCHVLFSPLGLCSAYNDLSSLSFSTKYDSLFNVWFNVHLLLEAFPVFLGQALSLVLILPICFRRSEQVSIHVLLIYIPTVSSLRMGTGCQLSVVCFQFLAKALAQSRHLSVCTIYSSLP